MTKSSAPIHLPITSCGSSPIFPDSVSFLLIPQLLIDLEKHFMMVLKPQGTHSAQYHWIQ